jgi:sensor domain CHASE-containing protein
VIPESPDQVKVGVILLAVVLGCTLIDQIVDPTSTTCAMQHYWNEQAIRDYLRCKQDLQREAQHLAVFTSHWAAWDNTHEFVRSLDKKYVESNFVLRTFQDDEINLFASSTDTANSSGAARMT